MVWKWSTWKLRCSIRRERLWFIYFCVNAAITLITSCLFVFICYNLVFLLVCRWKDKAKMLSMFRRWLLYDLHDTMIISLMIDLKKLDDLLYPNWWKWYYIQPFLTSPALFFKLLALCLPVIWTEEYITHCSDRLDTEPVVPIVWLGSLFDVCPLMVAFLCTKSNQIVEHSSKNNSNLRKGVSEREGGLHTFSFSPLIS